MSSIEKVAAYLTQHERDAVARLVEWLRIPSISTDPKFRAEVRKAADWAAARLKEAGLEVSIRETGTKEKPGHPIVWASSGGAPGYAGPHVLFYGHYDVQPPEPLHLWESPPFEPVIKPAVPGGPDERIVARGAVDDKGQVASFIEALLAWKHTHGSVPLRLTVLLEGEEESGSVNLERFVESHDKELRACDVCVISDTGMLGRGKPAITYGVRGLSYTEVILHGPDQDLHSGQWGGRMPNPLNELTKVLAQLWDADRRITIPGFYDAVQEPTKEERDAWKRLGFDQIAALKSIGMPPEADVGEKGWTALEREWARPTAEINGMVGGYTGAGAKTVIPSHASAKVSFRLVANQDPRRITESFFDWCRKRTPPGSRWEFIDHSGGFPGNVATDSPSLQAARRALKAASGVDPALIKSGGSIPVVGLLKDSLGLDTILVGFGLDDDRVHSPNEKFEIPCFRLGMQAHARLIEEFRKMKA